MHFLGLQVRARYLTLQYTYCITVNIPVLPVRSCPPPSGPAAPHVTGMYFVCMERSDPCGSSSLQRR